METREYRRDDYLISTDKDRLDLNLIHSFLTRSYWAKGIGADVVQRSIANSLTFGVYKGNKQIGFARVITDYATFAYLADVFILEPFRGKGLARWLMDAIVAHPDLQGLRRWLLVTRDAHGLYKQVGFTPVDKPETYMQKHDPNIYSRAKAPSNRT